MPSILLIINKPSGGGAEKVFSTLLAGFLAAGYRVKVFYTSKSKIKFRLLRFILNYLKILVISIRFNPIIISGLHEENLLAFLAPTSNKKILSLHTNEFPKGKLGFIHNQLYKLASSRSNTELVCVSNGLKNIFCKKIEGFKSSVIYNGLLDFSKIYHSPKDINVSNYNPRELKNILVVGRFVHQKNIILAISIFEEWQKINKDLKLTIIGEGPQANQINFAIKGKGLDEKITIKPWTNRIEEEYQKHEILLFTSKWEGFGNVIIEAISQGLYVFSTDCNFGPREIIFPEMDINRKIDSSFLSNSYGTIVKYSPNDTINRSVLLFTNAYESYLTEPTYDHDDRDMHEFYERFSKAKLIKNYTQLLGL